MLACPYRCLTAERTLEGYPTTECRGSLTRVIRRVNSTGVFFLNTCSRRLTDVQWFDTMTA